MNAKGANEPIRVLHVVTTMNRGGLETMLMNYYRRIDRNIVQFDFLEHRDNESDYDQEILALGGRIFRLPKLNPFSILYHKKLSAFFRHHQEYKIVHVHQDCLSSIALKAAYQNHVPIRIAHSHNASQDKNMKYLLKKYFMKGISQYASYLFACSKEAGNWMFLGERFTVLNNAIDTSKFVYDSYKRIMMREQLGIENEMVIGHVGRFNKQKNHDFLIDVFYEITKLEKNSKLILVGSGDLRNRVEEKVKKLCLEERVLFLGSRSDVNDLMQAMDVFVFPSNYEGLPVTLVEAQASGLPVIKSSNVPDQCVLSPLVVSLSLEISARDWAKAIIKIEKEYVREDTSEYIFKHHFDIENNAKRLQKFYWEKFNECAN